MSHEGGVSLEGSIRNAVKAVLVFGLPVSTLFAMGTQKQHTISNKTVRPEHEHIHLAAMAAYDGGEVPGWSRMKMKGGDFNKGISYFGRGNEVIISFRGSVDIQDAILDQKLLFGWEWSQPRFTDAVKITRMLLMEGKKVTLTGHSLGGTLAGIASRLIDRVANVKVPAVVFNPGSGPMTWRRGGGDITAYWTPLDPISILVRFTSKDIKLIKF